MFEQLPQGQRLALNYSMNCIVFLLRQLTNKKEWPSESNAAKKYYCSWPQLEVALECKKSLTIEEGLLVDLLSMTNVIILTIRPTTNIK